MRPLVVVIENPDEDPTVLSLGNVEIVELSSYAISRYGDECDIVDTGYEEELRELLARITKHFLPTERVEAEEHLNWMLSEVARRMEEYGAE
jgi:hypothetical protein